MIIPHWHYSAPAAALHSPLASLLAPGPGNEMIVSGSGGWLENPVLFHDFFWRWWENHLYMGGSRGFSVATFGSQRVSNRMFQIWNRGVFHISRRKNLAWVHLQGSKSQWLVVLWIKPNFVSLEDLHLLFRHIQTNYHSQMVPNRTLRDPRSLGMACPIPLLWIISGHTPW